MLMKRILSILALTITSCPIVGAITTVHIVPHTHDDVGWLKTVDQYFTNSNNSIQVAGVRQILNSVVAQLSQDPSRQFTYVEQAFFQRWYRELDAMQRANVKKLVANGQLTFVNGGWCMHDEAATHYVAMVDQQTLGHRLLRDEFGDDGVPTIGWQLDPFGHSATHAALLSAEDGMDALFFGRIDYQDLDLRHKTNRSEFVWRPSPSLGADSQIFTGLTGEYGGNYGPPAGFSFRHNSWDEPIEDNVKLSTYNVPARVDQAVAAAQAQAAMTRGEHIMWTMGSDFNYMNADVWYWNMDRLIEAVNADGRIVMKYSNPKTYAAAKKAEAASGAVQWPIDTADFFPYADGPHQFWTGYFTSRPALKGYVRETSGWFSAVRQAHALASARTPSAAGVHKLEELEEALGVAQHHDAVSGTAKQHVAFDYARRIAKGRAAAMPLFAQSVDSLLQAAGGAPIRDAAVPQSSGAQAPGWDACDRLNETVCRVTQSDTTVTLVAWSGLAQRREELFQLPVHSTTVSVTLANGSALPSQVSPVAETVTNYRRHTSEATHVLSFVAPLEPLAANAFTITQGAAAVSSRHGARHGAIGSSAPTSAHLATIAAAAPATGDMVLENEFLALNFSRATGRLASLYNKATKTAIALTQSFCYYVGNTGDKASGQHSGAYIFRPINGSVCLPIGAGVTSATIVQGTVSSEVRQTFAPWLTQVVRLRKGARHADFEWTVGEIDLADPTANKTLDQCVSWRQTAGCDAGGARQPTKDKGCNVPVQGNLSGYCECFGGRKARMTGCGHVGFTCAAACRSLVGKEVVSKFTSSIASHGELLTDSNGREMLLRKRNFRPTWNLTQTEPVAGNYYPINAAVAIRDAAAQLTVLVDRSQGAGSIVDGSLELMVHRRLLQDDARGVGEPHDETQDITPYYRADGYYGGPGGVHSGPGLVVRGTHAVSVEPPATAARVWRPLADRVFAKPALLFRGGRTMHRSTPGEQVSVGPGNSPTGVSPLAQSLPPNVAVMTLLSLSPGSLLLRLAHQFGLNEDAVLSKPAHVDLASLFDPTALKISSAREVSLTNNQNKSDIMRKRREAAKWTPGVETEVHPWRREAPLDFKKSGVVTLGPLEIKTFVLEVTKLRNES